MGGEFRINPAVIYYGPDGIDLHAPTGGFWGGDGWSDNHRTTPGEITSEDFFNRPFARNAYDQPSKIDEACRTHDKAYWLAEPYKTTDPAYYRELIARADLQLIIDVFSVPLSQMDCAEVVYQQNVYRAFLAKLALDGYAELYAEINVFLAEHGFPPCENENYSLYPESWGVISASTARAIAVCFWA